MLYQTLGTVLSQRQLGENDKVITLLTPEEGLVRAAVKGARKATSKLSAVTQPYTSAIFQIYRGKSLDRVTQVSINTSRAGILSDYPKAVSAAYLSELVTELASERESDVELFRFFSAVLDCLEKRPDPWVVVRWAEIGLLLRAGLLPSFAEGETGPDETSSSEVTAGTLRTLSILSEATYSCPNLTARGQVREEVDLVVARCVAHALGKRLKSASLVDSILADPRSGTG